jgi:membrane-associated protease RseP (regulator of RpoE activity)
VAAWVGMYATALNLLPSSQLDGGHIVYAVAPRAHRVISWMTVLVLIYLGSRKVLFPGIPKEQAHFNLGWWFWAGLIIVMNVLTFHQEQAPDYPMLPPSRWVWAIVAIIMLGLTFTVVPFVTP